MMNAIARRPGIAVTLAVLATTAMAAEEPKVKDLMGGPEVATPTEEAPQETAPPVVTPGPADDFDRGVPRASVEGFLAAAAEGDWERAGEYLDVRRLPRSVATRDGADLARQLAFLMDRFLWIHPETLSAKPEGHAEDGLPENRDFVGRLETPERQIDVLVQRVPRSDGVSIWKFATVTLLIAWVIVWAPGAQLRASHDRHRCGGHLAGSTRRTRDDARRRPRDRRPCGRAGGPTADRGSDRRAHDLHDGLRSSR